jgi:Rod binding domain-containing protein
MSHWTMGGQSGLLTQPGVTSAAAAPSPKLVHAAHEFEAALMKELLAPLETGKDGLTGGDEDDAGSSSALGSFAGEALGKAISERGGFGIATGILKHFSAVVSQTGTGNHSGKASVLRPQSGMAGVSASDD